MLTSLRHSAAFRFAQLLALWAMLLPALLPLLHHPAAMGGTSIMPPDCQMAMGGGESKQQPDPNKSQPSCPICQSLNNLAQGFVAPEHNVVLVFQFVVSLTLGLVHDGASFAIPTSSWPRAPPALA